MALSLFAAGPTDAIIGNMAGGGEPYSGTIDEVAIYDFALAPSEITEHWRNVQAGSSYFGTDGPASLRQDLWRNITLLKAGEAMRFDSETGIALDTIKADESRFRGNVARAGG